MVEAAPLPSLPRPFLPSRPFSVFFFIFWEKGRVGFCGLAGRLGWHRGGVHVCGGRVGTPREQVVVDSEFSAAAVELTGFLRFEDLGALLSCSHYSVDSTWVFRVQCLAL
jgi:hypothetical protein